MPAPARQNRPIRFHALVAGGFALCGMLLLWWGLSRRVDWGPLLACWLASVNVTAFGYYGYDKARARADRSRVPEVVLHGLTAAGGALGAYAGMETFRHKTVKGSFRIVFWLLAALQIALAAWVVKRIWWG